MSPQDKDSNPDQDQDQDQHAPLPASASETEKEQEAVDQARAQDADASNTHPVTTHYAAITLLGVTTLILSTLLLLSYAVTVSIASPAPALYLVNTFGFFVGTTIILLSFYLQFGQKVEFPFTPIERPPPHIPATLFIIGAAVILTSIRMFSESAESALFWRVVGYSLILAVSTALCGAFIRVREPADQDWA